MPFVQMGRAWRESGIRQREDQERERENAEQKAQREIQMAALLAGLSERGIVPKDQMPSVRTPSMPGIPSMNMPTGRPLGDTGYVQDLTKTPEARERSAAMQEREQLRPAIALAKQRVPELQGASDEQVAAWLRNKELRDAMGGGEEVNWQTEVDAGGNVVRVNPRTGKTEYVNAPEGGRLQARPPASMMVPTPVQFLQTPGGYVTADPRNPDAPARPLRGADGEQVRPATGGIEVEKRAAVLRNVGDALDGFEQTLRQTGSVLDPRKPEHGVLQSAYENYQLQLKELYALGVLAGPDLMLMRRIVNDPTDPKTRLLSGGNAQAHAQRVLGQIAQARRVLANYTRNAAPVREGRTTAPPAGGISDADIADIVNRNTPGRQ